MIQQGKSSTGFGAFGSSSQMLFGGSGGQDILQKITWVLGALFMVGSLVLSLARTNLQESAGYLTPKAEERTLPFEK
jgi:protein translocase SecG subunit